MKENDTESETSIINQEQEEFFEHIENEDIKKIEKLLTQNLEIWTYRSKDNDNSTVLHLSVFKKLFDITVKLIEYCKKHNSEGLKDFINEPNDQGVTAFHYASFRGNTKIIRLLIENGADVFKKTKRDLNVIHYSCQGNRPNSLMYFYLYFQKKNKEGLKLITAQDKAGSTPLHWASYSNAEDVLLYLINLDIFNNERERQDFIDKQDNQGYTALHLSVTGKSVRIVMKLLQNGAKSDLKDKKGKDPLQLAQEKKQKDIEEIIKNNQSIQCCNVKAPVKQIKKSSKNIICVFLVQIIVTSLLFFIIIPFSFNILENKNEDNNSSNITNNIYINNIINNNNSDNNTNEITNLCYNSLFIFYVVFLILFFILYIALLIIDPGIINSDSIDSLEQKLNSDEELLKYCYKCYIRKTRNSKHCIICDKCYDGFDHHCYWINKCVAKKNYKLFLFFLFETFIYLALILTICIFGFINFLSNKVKDQKEYKLIIELKIQKQIFDLVGGDKMIYLILIIIVTIIDLFFLIPELILLILHINVFCSNYKENKNVKDNLIALKDNSLMSNDTSSESEE